MLGQLAHDLLNDPVTQARAEAFKDRLLEHPQVVTTAVSLWKAMRSALLGSIQERDGAVRQRLLVELNLFSQRLRDDAALRERLDRAAADLTVFVVERYGAEVTTVITHTIERWDGKEAARRIELHVGRDLQFIRINGTIVGGLVGVLIHAVSLVAGGLRRRWCGSAPAGLHDRHDPAPALEGVGEGVVEVGEVLLVEPAVVDDAQHHLVVVEQPAAGGVGRAGDHEVGRRPRNRAWTTSILSCVSTVRTERSGRVPVGRVACIQFSIVSREVSTRTLQPASDSRASSARTSARWITANIAETSRAPRVQDRSRSVDSSRSRRLG